MRGGDGAAPTLEPTIMTHPLRTFRRAMARRDFAAACAAAEVGRNASSPRGNGWSVWTDRLDEAQIGLASAR